MSSAPTARRYWRVSAEQAQALVLKRVEACQPFGSARVIHDAMQAEAELPLRVHARNGDRFPINLFRGRGKDLELVAEIPAGGEWLGDPEEGPRPSDKYWADSALVEFEDLRP